MRDVKRIKKFCDELAKIWAASFPDWRFGQFCSNFFGWLVSEKKKDLWFPEEKAMIEYIKEYALTMTGGQKTDV